MTADCCFVVIGSGQPALAALAHARNRGVKCLFVTSPRLVDERSDDGRRFVDRAAELGCDTHVVSSLKDILGTLLDLAANGGILFSFGSPFIFSAALIDAFGGRAFNSHPAPLPMWRGGGGYSWRIMAGDRNGCVCFHRLTAGVDDGDIVFRRDHVFPDACRYPIEYMRHDNAMIGDSLPAFLDGLFDGNVPDGTPQDESRATYFPRLNTATHGHIDWRWPAEAIVRFILAFSHPYPGAKTTLNGEQASLFDAELADPTPGHPFFAGLVFRATEEHIFVACGDGNIAIRRGDMTCAAAVAPGDRFVTPIDALERAQATRVLFTPDGQKTR